VTPGPLSKDFIKTLSFCEFCEIKKQAVWVATVPRLCGKLKIIVKLKHTKT